MNILKSIVAAATIVMAGAAMAQPVTLINMFEVPAGKEEATLGHWERAKEFLAIQPGYRSTRLHQALSPQARYVFINIAQWDSAEAFQQAMKALQDARFGPLPEGVSFSPALYRVVRE